METVGRMANLPTRASTNSFTFKPSVTPQRSFQGASSTYTHADHHTIFNNLSPMGVFGNSTEAGGHRRGTPTCRSSAAPLSSPITDIEVDSALEQELTENGSRSTRRTKLICTIGPACCSEQMLDALASGGMNVARLNMSHATHEWHRDVIQRIRKLNKDKGYSVAIMMDTEGGSEMHLSSLDSPLKASAGEEFTLTIRDPSTCSGNQLAISFGGFVEDVVPGDMVIVDGGMATFEVSQTSGPDVQCRVMVPGLLLPKATITVRRKGALVRAKNALLPVISAKDWTDIDLAIEQKIDFIAVSFVKGADILHNLRSYVASRSSRVIEIVAKIESYDSIPNLPAIVEASDAVMVARGDLGSQIALEDVPSLQKEIVQRCRQRGKPVIVASQLLESMHTLPTPTRAEVADIADAVRQRADALMLSGESAIGSYPERALDVLRTVSTRMEEWVREERHGQISLPEISSTSDGRVSEELCAAAASVANSLNARAIFCFTKRGFMANFLSRMRPDAPIYAFTDKQETRQRLNLRWGVIPFRLDFSSDPETNVARTFSLLKRRDLVASGDLVVVVSDVRQEQAPESEAGIIRSVQVRRVP